jgi:hypothetical protein
MIRHPCGNILLGETMTVCGALICLFIVEVIFVFDYVLWAIVNRGVGEKKGRK